MKFKNDVIANVNYDENEVTKSIFIRKNCTENNDTSTPEQLYEMTGLIIRPLFFAIPTKWPTTNSFEKKKS